MRLKERCNMRLKILGETYDSPSYPSEYRGVERRMPYYVDSVGDSHKVNKSFQWFIENSDEVGILSDLEGAKKLVNDYNTLRVAPVFEIVEITRPGEEPKTDVESLGHDLAHQCNHSLLVEGLKLDDRPVGEWPPSDPVWILPPLFRLIQEHFRPMLNRYWLFEDYEVAQFCLDCMMALQRFVPDLWESDEVKYEVIKLWKVH
jgi:hypothetical protein